MRQSKAELPHPTICITGSVMGSFGTRFFRGKAFAKGLAALFVLAGLGLAAPAGADHHGSEHLNPTQTKSNGCIKQEDGGFVCQYAVPKGFDSVTATDKSRRSTFEGCLKELYSSCRTQGGGRNCGWTAKLSCRSLSQPKNTG